MPRQRSPLVHLVFFLLTVVSTIVAGIDDPNVKTVSAAVLNGLPFSATLLSILLCHEFGHYIAGRLHKVDISLPLFIPLPIGNIGTLGAVISIRSKLPSRRAVLDIGAAGPIAGFVVALPLLVWGFAESKVVHGLPVTSPNAAFQSPFAMLSAWVHHSSRPFVDTGSIIFGDSILTWLVARLTHGPLAPGSDIFVSPVARAAWVGMLVTTMNMTPLGQLDGGHVIFALFGRWSRLVSQIFSHALLGLGLFASWNWLVWWALTRFLVGVGHPLPEEMEPLGPVRKAVAIASLVILVLTFVPVPISI